MHDCPWKSCRFMRLDARRVARLEFPGRLRHAAGRAHRRRLECMRLAVRSAETQVCDARAHRPLRPDPDALQKSFRGLVYCTNETAAIARILLRDAAELSDIGFTGADVDPIRWHELLGGHCSAASIRSTRTFLSAFSARGMSSGPCRSPFTVVRPDQASAGLRQAQAAPVRKRGFSAKKAREPGQALGRIA